MGPGPIFLQVWTRSRPPSPVPTPRTDASGGSGGPDCPVVYDPAADLRALFSNPGCWWPG
jgi:hypothetical protein